MTSLAHIALLKPCAAGQPALSWSCARSQGVQKHLAEATLPTRPTSPAQVCCWVSLLQAAKAELKLCKPSGILKRLAGATWPASMGSELAVPRDCPVGELLEVLEFTQVVLVQSPGPSSQGVAGHTDFCSACQNTLLSHILLQLWLQR